MGSDETFPLDSIKNIFVPPLQVGTIISEKIPVTVAYMSAFTPTPTSPLRVAAGRAAVFAFPPISSVPLPAVTWQADDGSGLHGQKYETTTDNRLVILSVDSGDSKKYRCALITL